MFHSCQSVIGVFDSPVNHLDDGLFQLCMRECMCTGSTRAGVSMPSND